MKELIQKLEDEKYELQDKIENLESFLDSEKLKDIKYSQRGLLFEQLHYMKKYFIVLETRISDLIEY